MKFSENAVHEIKVAYIGGGSKAWAWDFMSDLALENSLSGQVVLYDIDYYAAKSNEVIGNRIHEQDRRWGYQAAATLEEALYGADFVVISILPGTLDEMQSDVHAPEQYGIYQSVGDTVGPGGIVRAMRTLPMYDVIVRGIMKLCPEAWVINYTNPMTLCVSYMYKVFPKIKAFGCCHEVFGTQRVMAYVVSNMLEDGKKVERQQIHTNVMGINHFTWINKAAYRGKDIMPFYARLANECREKGLFGIGTKPLSAKYFLSDNRVKFDLFLRYGIAAAAGDRHLAEFCPPWYLKCPETAHYWGFELTPVSYRREMYVERLKKSKALVSGEIQFEIKPSGEEGVRQMKALLGFGDIVTNVNVPNVGQIANLPLGAVVETNVVFSHNSIQPVVAGSIPENVNALIYPHVINQQLITQAVEQRNIDMVFQAFVNDPMVNISMVDARDLFHAMVRNTRKYLDWWY